jgi:D-3-phosphoglycerate dehydrogenase / 2-oxoglutarate reductase
MKQFRIKTINAIAQEGLALFSERFAVNPDETNPEGIVVRSSKVDLDPLSGVAGHSPGWSRSQ